MRSVFVAGSLTEAELMVDRLKQIGIPSVIRNRELQGALGELPLTLLPELYVLDDAHFDAARAQVEAVEKQEAITQEIVCSSCKETNPGNFELCWNCRAEL